MSTPGTLFTLSAPSGAGKTSLAKELVESTEGICVSVSHTTRPMRPGERDGINYHFIDDANFKKMTEATAFLEQARVFDNYYGTSKVWVETTLAEGNDVILEIDWQGAKQVRQLLPDSVSIFILPPSRSALEERLQSRGQDRAEVIAQRLSEAAEEMSHYANADFLIVNDEFDLALKQIRSIITTQRLEGLKQQQRHKNLLIELLS